MYTYSTYQIQFHSENEDTESAKKDIYEHFDCTEDDGIIEIEEDVENDTLIGLWDKFNELMNQYPKAEFVVTGYTKSGSDEMMKFEIEASNGTIEISYSDWFIEFDKSSYSDFEDFEDEYRTYNGEAICSKEEFDALPDRMLYILDSGYGAIVDELPLHGPYKKRDDI